MGGPTREKQAVNGPILAGDKFGSMFVYIKLYSIYNFELPMRLVAIIPVYKLRSE
jgi:hypothetical protein